jgi:O-antigen ligase
MYKAKDQILCGLRNNSWYIFLALVPILIYSPFTLDPVLHIRYISLALYEIIGIIILFRNIRQQNTMPRWGLYYFIGWGLYLLMSFIGLIVSVDRSGDGSFLWLQIIMVGMLPLILSQIFLDFALFSDAVLKLFVLTGIFSLAVGTFQLSGIIFFDQLGHAATYEVTSVFAHKNIFSEILIIIVPTSLIALFSLKGFWKYVSLIVAVCCLLMIIILMSKAVWVAFLVGTFTTLIAWLSFGKIKPLKIDYSITKKYKRLLFVCLIISLAGFFTVFSLRINKPLKTQLRDLTTIHAYANKDRLELWKKTFQLTRNHTFTGIGLGNWKIDILKEFNKDLVSDDNLTFFQRPHNDYLWIFSEQGLPSLLFYLFTIFLIITMCCRLALHSVNFKARLSYLLIIFAIISYMTYACFSFPKERVEHSVLLGFLFALILIDYNRSFEKRAVKFSKLFFVPFSILIFFALYIGITRYISELHLKHAYEARLIQDWKKESPEAGRAYSRFYKMDFASTPIKWYKGEAYFNQGNINEALNNFKEAEKVNPYHIHVLNNIGTCYELKGNHALAIKYYQKAIDYSSYFEDAFFNLSAVYYNLNDYENAIAALQKRSEGVV